jgi:hypothetical protein
VTANNKKYSGFERRKRRKGSEERIVRNSTWTAMEERKMLKYIKVTFSKVGRGKNEKMKKREREKEKEKERERKGKREREIERERERE